MNNPVILQRIINREIDRFVHIKSLSDFNFVKILNSEYQIVVSFSVADKDLRYRYDFQVINTLISNSNDIQWQTPLLRLLSPQIPTNLDIHKLSGSLICYTFPGDLRFNKGLTCGYAVEQAFKWAFGYEFYLEYSYWPFNEMPHGIYPIHWGFFRPRIAA